MSEAWTYPPVTKGGAPDYQKIENASWFDSSCRAGYVGRLVIHRLRPGQDGHVQHLCSEPGANVPRTLGAHLFSLSELFCESLFGLNFPGGWSWSWNNNWVMWSTYSYFKYVWCVGAEDKVYRKHRYRCGNEYPKIHYTLAYIKVRKALKILNMTIFTLHSEEHMSVNFPGW